jgi:putative phosphoribosyl transferase
MTRTTVDIGSIRLAGDLSIPEEPSGTVVFAHGSGSSHRSPRNLEVARTLNQAGLATLLFDLLDPSEAEDRDRVFDVPLLAERLLGATNWLRERVELTGLSLGYFGASTGAAAALSAAAGSPHGIGAVVSRGGRPDLVPVADLEHVVAPTLLIVGGNDRSVLDLNREVQRVLRCESRLEVVLGATHLFEEPGAMERVTRLATGWFLRHLAPGDDPTLGR